MGTSMEMPTIWNLSLLIFIPILSRYSTSFKKAGVRQLS